MTLRVIAINDLCGLGHSSLAVALPVLSAMGHQVLPVPTAILSSQTDGFDHYINVDLSTTLPDYLNHWHTVKVSANALYSGYLASAKQINDVIWAINHLLDSKALVLVDPVLGDGGQLYDTMDEKMVLNMQNLIAHAKLITPNATELCALCGESLKSTLPTTFVEKAMHHLTSLGPRFIVVTSFDTDKGQLLTAAYDAEQNKFSIHPTPYLPVHYPGTGDLFASVLLGHLINKQNLATATQQACDFVTKAIRAAIAEAHPPREGVPFEGLLSELFPKLTV